MIEIKTISDGSDFEVWRKRKLVATCGTRRGAMRIVALLHGAERALAHLKICDDHESDSADTGAQAIDLLTEGLRQ